MKFTLTLQARLEASARKHDEQNAKVESLIASLADLLGRAGHKEWFRQGPRTIKSRMASNNEYSSNISSEILAGHPNCVLTWSPQVRLIAYQHFLPEARDRYTTKMNHDQILP